MNDGLTKREDLFVVTKIADIHHDRATESQEHQLKLLGLEYSGINEKIDLKLSSPHIHRK